MMVPEGTVNGQLYSRHLGIDPKAGLGRKRALPASIWIPDLCRSVELIYISVQLPGCPPMSREIGGRHPFSDLAFSRVDSLTDHQWRTQVTRDVLESSGG